MLNSNYLIFESEFSRDAVVASLNRSGLCVLFVVDQAFRLQGVVSDGDVRRAESVTGEPFTFNVNVVCATDRAEAETALRRRPGLKALPIVDEEGRIIDVVSVQDLVRFSLVSQDFSGDEEKNVLECLRSGWISSQGRFVREFETSFSQLLGVSQSVACSNGTVALHLCLLGLGVGPGDEVIVPDITFAATINAVIYAGATPVIVDVNKDGVLTAEGIRKSISAKTKAVIHVHLYGWAGGIGDVAEECRRQDILLIEDCAEALGSEEFGQVVGSIGDASAFSFFGNKTITTGEGGMACFRSAEHAEKACLYRDHGMSRDRRYWHEVVGHNYRMTNLQAAIGVAQLSRIEDIVQRKIALSEAYTSFLKNNKNILLPPSSPNVKNTYWLYVITIQDTSKHTRDELIGNLEARNMEVRPAFFCLSDMPPYRQYCSVSTPVAHQFSERAICLPSSTGLSRGDIQQICTVLSDLL